MPLIFTKTSSRCHFSPGRGRSWLARAHPNFAHECRIVSSLTTTPRVSISSSTSRTISENRKYNQTHGLVISTGSGGPRRCGPRPTDPSRAPLTNVTLPSASPSRLCRTSPSGVNGVDEGVSVYVNNTTYIYFGAVNPNPFSDSRLDLDLMASTSDPMLHTHGRHVAQGWLFCLAVWSTTCDSLNRQRNAQVRWFPWSGNHTCHTSHT
jgi:hypothetical protein